MEDWWTYGQPWVNQPRINHEQMKWLNEKIINGISGSCDAMRMGFGPKDAIKQYMNM